MSITTPQSRLSAPIHWFALLAVIAFGLAFGPIRLQAQEQAPSASGQTAASPAAPDHAYGLPAQPGQEKKEEREEENVYRHTALVTSMAKALHMSVETTARIFEFINFAIIALAIAIPLGKILPKVIRKRSATLNQNLESARKTTADANARLSAVEAQLSRLDEEIAKIRAQVEEESKQDEARIKAAIEEESARIVASAEQEINVAAAQAKRGLRYFAADLAIEQAARQLVLTPEIDRALIAEFISEAPQNGGKGGQN